MFNYNRSDNMYYSTVEQAVASEPTATHILTTASEWCGDPEVRGMFVPAWFYEKYNKYFAKPFGRLELSDEPMLVGPDGYCVAHSVQDTLTAPYGTEPPLDQMRAYEFLERGVKHMKDRAVQRDADDGERSMKRCVEAFNALEGTSLTEAQGWRFMIALKYARSVNGVFTADDYEDMAAYSGLAGEAAQNE